MYAFDKKIVVSVFTLLVSLPVESWAVFRGQIAKGPAYAAVVGLDRCSGVIIHPRAILTAAHCEPRIDKGSNDVYFSNRHSADKIQVKEIYVNEGYVKDVSWRGEIKINDDIALIVLSEPIQNAVVLANIPKIVDESTLLKNETLTAVGMGMYSHSLGAELGDDNNAKKRMASYQISEKHVSAYFLNATSEAVGICGGDSGGGLLRVSADGTRSELVGILTATGGDCGERNQTDYAESVSSHLNWIKEKLKKEEISGF